MRSSITVVVAAFCAAGYDVVFTYQRSHEAAAELVREMAATGAHAAGHCCDSADEEAVNALARGLLVERGAPHAVVNNVGITRDAVLMRMSSAQWTDVVNANLNASFYVTRAFAHAMVEEGDGVILQMSSVSGFKGNVGQTNYSATKAAMIGMTRSLALELGRFNVRVNAIAPGFITTEMTAEILNILARLAEGGTTMLFVTHEIEFARQISDRIVFLDKGRLVVDLPTAEFFAPSGGLA